MLCCTPMLNDLLGTIWRRAPKSLRRWTVRLSQTRFAVTAGAVVTDSRGRVLLLKHRFRPGMGWGMPGGFIKEGEQPQEALRRELREEVGLEVEELKLFTVRAFKRPRQVEIVFSCRAVGDTEQLSFEIQQAAWFVPGEFPKELPKDQAQLIRSALSDGATPPG
jgi:8-oxo-dGTP diphosphatase